MIVPDYWAEARKHHRESNRQVTVRRFGWSMSSADDATVMAQERAEQALARILRGEKLDRREPKVPYNGAAGVPIREQVLSRHGDEVITRNGYGARCLNSPRALFADVDFEPQVGFAPIIGALALLAGVALLAGLTFASWGVGLGLLIAAAVFALPLAKVFVRIRTAAAVGPGALAAHRLTAFLRHHPDWNVRVYRTPAGLRLLATHRPFDPLQDEVQDFFDALGVDSVYVRMCRNQRCFRARLTAKPWRIGISDHIRPRPGTWPVAPERAAERASWIAAYDAKAAAYAACRYVESVGSGVVDPTLHDVVALHDRESRADDPSCAIA